MSMQNPVGTPNARRLAEIPVMDRLLRDPAATALVRLRASPFLAQLPAWSEGTA